MADRSPLRVLVLPEVRRVEEIDGERVTSEVEPPAVSAWSIETMLAWQTAVAALDSGVPLTVYVDDDSPQPAFGFNVGAASTSCMPYASAHAWLWGFVDGVQAGRVQAAR